MCLRPQVQLILTFLPKTVILWTKKDFLKKSKKIQKKG